MGNAKWLPEEPLAQEDRELLKPLLELAKELGRTPTKGEVSNSSKLKNRFGPWNKVILAAGLPPLSEPEQTRQRQCEKQKG